MGKISVFCSYAREDERYRQQLESHLAPLRDSHVIDDWYDNRIQAGTRWGEQVRSALDDARLILFIVTPDLLASRYVREVELPRALELERTGRCRVVPIVARKAAWGDSPLAAFQALPQSARPIASYRDPDDAYEEVVEGLKEVCKRIVDWENPYKRAKVGDWTHAEQTTTLDAQSISVEISLELVEKTAERAVVLLEGTADKRMKRKLTIDLTQPLGDDMGNLVQQLGDTLPANAEVRVGPQRSEEEALSIGGRRYQTVKTTREIVFAQQGWEKVGTASTWRCIDVPLDGIVKAVSDLPGVMRQNLVLLDYGHGKKGRRPGKPAKKAAPSVLVGPGRWRMQMSMFGVQTAYDLFLQPGGRLQGSQLLMGMAGPLQGRWGFDTNANVLTLELVASMMGLPVGQELIQMQLQGRRGSVIHAVDGSGRQFALQRLA